MCIAIIKPSGVPLPKEEVLERCFVINPDGAGYSTLSSNGKGFSIRKGFFNFDEYYKALKGAIKTDTLAFIHMRIATCGYVDKKGQLWATAGQCHPFPVTTDYSLMQRTRVDCVNEVFMHNGTIDIDTDEHKGKETSDTMTFNRMTAKGGLDPFNKGARMFIEVASDPCRLAYMRLINGVPSYTTVGEWDESEGCLYSNDGYKRRLVPEAEQLRNSTNNYLYNYKGNTTYIGGFNNNVGYLTPEDMYCVWYGECPISLKALKDNKCKESKRDYTKIVKWLDTASFRSLLLEGFSREMAWDICNSRKDRKELII